MPSENALTMHQLCFYSNVLQTVKMYFDGLIKRLIKRHSDKCRLSRRHTLYVIFMWNICLLPCWGSWFNSVQNTLIPCFCPISLFVVCKAALWNESVLIHTLGDGNGSVWLIIYTHTLFRKWKSCSLKYTKLDFATAHFSAFEARGVCGTIFNPIPTNF